MQRSWLRSFKFTDKRNERRKGPPSHLIKTSVHPLYGLTSPPPILFHFPDHTRPIASDTDFSRQSYREHPRSSLRPDQVGTKYWKLHYYTQSLFSKGLIKMYNVSIRRHTHWGPCHTFPKWVTVGIQKYSVNQKDPEQRLVNPSLFSFLLPWTDRFNCTPPHLSLPLCKFIYW